MRIKEIKIHFEAWNKWRRSYANNKVHKMLVLLNFAVSPTFDFYKKRLINGESLSISKIYHEYGKLIAEGLREGIEKGIDEETHKQCVEANKILNERIRSGIMEKESYWMTNVEMIEEMLDMQKALDKKIYTKKGVEFNKDKCFMALIDEIGEFTHELKARWCWWKNKCKEVDEEKVLEELVDIWHFVLSMCNYDEGDSCKCMLEKFKNDEEQIANFHDKFKEASNGFETSNIIINLLVECPGTMLANLYVLTYRTRYTISDVYEAYKKKNSVNYERLKNGY